MTSAGALDDYLDELLADAVPAVASPSTAANLPAPAAEIPGDSPELEAAFEEALAALQAARTSGDDIVSASAACTPPSPPPATGEADAEPTWDDVPPELPAASAQDIPGQATEPTWDDLPDEVIYETDPAESARLAHADSPALESAFDLAAGIAPVARASMPPPAPAAADHTPPAPARPNTWQELQAQARQPGSAPQNRRASERASRWLRLRCGPQTYALELLKVQEVVLPVPLLALRGTGVSMLGIMNLRGQVVPVMDLCLHLGVATPPEDTQTRIVVLEENGEVLGLRVSAVEDVANLTDSQIEPPDTARICQISNELFRGIARVGSQPMILLDATRLLQ